MKTTFGFPVMLLPVMAVLLVVTALRDDTLAAETKKPTSDAPFFDIKTDDTAKSSESRIGAVAASVSVAGANVKDYPITPVDFTQVELHPGFWADRLEVNRTRSIPHAIRMLREDATDTTNSRIACFLLAAGLEELSDKETYVGARFGDTDLYKTIEAASYSLAVKPDRRLEKCMDILIATIAAAQEDDGYLYTNRTAHNNYPDRAQLSRIAGKTR